MNIAFVNRMMGMTWGGGEIWDFEVAKGLSEMGVDVTFYLGKPLFSGLRSALTEFEYVEVSSPYLRDLAYAAPRGIGGAIEDVDAYLFGRRVCRKLANEAFDVVYVNGDPRIGRFVSSVTAPWVLKLNGPPHSFLYDTVHPRRNSTDFVGAFDAVIATGVTVPWLRRRTEADVVRIDPGVDTSLFRPRRDPRRADPFTLLFVGRFVPVKNLPFLVAAFSSFQERYPDSRLRLVGDGPTRNTVRAAVADHRLESTVELPGYVPQESVPAEYRNSDVFVLTSKSESFGIVLLEAMSCGVPPVAPAIDWIPEIIDDGTDGRLYDPGDRESLVDVLAELRESPEERIEMGARAREKVAERHDWRQRAERARDVFESVVEGDSPEEPTS